MVMKMQKIVHLLLIMVDDMVINSMEKNERSIRWLFMYVPYKRERIDEHLLFLANETS